MTRELLPRAGRARVNPRDCQPTHLIALCEDAAELARAAAVCVRAGLASGDRVLYVASGPVLPAVRNALEGSSADARLALDAGQLVLRSFPGVHAGVAPRGLAAAVSEFRAAAGQARADGFPGLRIAADMSGITRVLSSIERALAWERMTMALRREEGVSSVCHYDRRQLGGEHSGQLAAEHTGAAPLSVSRPMASFRATRQGLRVTGELDMANRDRFIWTVSARLAAIPKLTMDVTGLVFIDAGTLGELHRVAAELPPDAHITLTGASCQLRRLARLVGVSPHLQLTIEPAAP